MTWSLARQSAFREALGVAESTIFHITEPALWEQALANGSYTGSTRGANLSDVGYIHCSFEHQVEMVANFLYEDWLGDLVVLEIDRSRVPAEIRVENLEGGDEKFPHIYGPLPASAVAAVHQLQRREDGWHRQLP